MYLGNILRYREEYKLPARHNEGHAPADHRNYKRATDTYEQAKLLSPDDGYASYQLAIVASYTSWDFDKSFACALHCYRALCVSKPCESALEKLDETLWKAVADYEKKCAKR